MSSFAILWLMVGALLAGVAVWFVGRSSADRLRQAGAEARQRETEATARAAEQERRYGAEADELKRVLTDLGGLRAEAARVAELRETVVERDNTIAGLRQRIEILEREKTVAEKNAEAAQDGAAQTIRQERESLKLILAAKDKQIEQLSEFTANARKALTDEFKAVSADALKDVSAQLVRTADGIIAQHGKTTTDEVKLHQQKIETLLKPVEETIRRLDKHVEETSHARTAAEAVLNNQVNRLAGASELLYNALRKPVVRGSWGEMTLINALESAGLEEEIDFVLQHSTAGEDGVKRTDALINLPKGRKLVIDSKNLMESYLLFAKAEDEAQKELHRKAHSRSLRGHIKDLWGKNYQDRYEGLDCVLLFIPDDGMYHAALQDEAEILREANEKRVFVVNPMTLIPLLKAVRYVLDQDRLNKSAKEISKVGEELYGELSRFAENVATIGSRLKSTVDAYNSVIPGLDRFIIAKSRKLKQLGAAKGMEEAELPEPIELEPRLFSSKELRNANRFLTDHNSGLALAAEASPDGE